MAAASVSGLPATVSQSLRLLPKNGSAITAGQGIPRRNPDPLSFAVTPLHPRATWSGKWWRMELSSERAAHRPACDASQ
jgi:hypothetical protein